MSHIRNFLDRLTREQLVDRLDLALEGAGLGIWDWDLRDDSVNFDRRWCEMVGLEHAATPMHLDTWKSRVHPDDLEGCYRDITAHIEGRTDRYENVHRMRHADGHWVWILDRGRISGRDEDGTPIRFTGTHFDVTAVEESRRVLERHERELRRLVTHLPSSVALFDLRGNALTVSPNWSLPGGPPPEQIVGRHVREIIPLSPLCDGVEAALGGEVIRVSEWRAASEPLCWLRWSAEPWFLMDHTIGGALLSVEDVTEDVMRRQQVRKENEARVSSLALFAGGVAHELNSPLQTILLASAMLHEQLQSPEPDLEELSEFSELIHQTAEQAGKIARALRTMSRDARHDPPERVRVAALFEHVEAMFASRTRVRDQILEIIPPDADLCVMGRPAELMHVLLNLMQNASDACQEQRECWIRLEAREEGGWVEIRCVDSGPGVAAAHRKDVMKPWFTTKPSGQGTGLGLAIADMLARRDGGELILAEDEPHTTFLVRLPTGAES